MSAVKRGRWAKGLVLDSASRMSSSSKSVSFQALSRLGHRPTLPASRSSGSDPAASSRSGGQRAVHAHVKRVKTQEGDVSVVVCWFVTCLFVCGGGLLGVWGVWGDSGCEMGKGLEG